MVRQLFVNWGVSGAHWSSLKNREWMGLLSPVNFYCTQWYSVGRAQDPLCNALHPLLGLNHRPSINKAPVGGKTRHREDPGWSVCACADQ